LTSSLQGHSTEKVVVDVTKDHWTLGNGFVQIFDGTPSDYKAGTVRAAGELNLPVQLSILIQSAYGMLPWKEKFKVIVWLYFHRIKMPIKS
jgi:hypothetical protein